MTLDEKQKKQIKEQQKWKKAFASIVGQQQVNPQLEEWKTAFQEVLTQHCSKVHAQPNLDIWAAAFKSVVSSWNVNPADTLSTVLQQNPQLPIPKAQQRTVKKAPLLPVSTGKKNDWLDIKELLDQNRINYFYHFTDTSNLESIKRNGGLYSWYSCEQKGINIPHPGGDPGSRMLDSAYGLEDYVRLSFCDDHPMAFRHKQNGANLVLLKVSTDVAYQSDTLFSDINATARGHSAGGSLNDLRKIDFDAVKKHYVSRTDPDFATHQAEVMVKTFVPISYILNIDNPISL